MHGFKVKAVYLDGISPEEKETFDWLREHAPELELIATIQVKMRVLPRVVKRKCLPSDKRQPIFAAAAILLIWCRGKGLYGFDGIRRTAELMMDAYREEKDTEKLVIQKGWGCECCL